MSKSTLPTTKMLSAYWLPSVGIGAAEGPPKVLSGDQTVTVPLTDILNYTRSDGSPQINVINLMGATFTSDENFNVPYLDFETNLQKLLDSGDIKKLQDKGIKVVLTILGNNGPGWSSLPEDKIQPFVDYLNNTFIAGGYKLDGIDIDDEYAKPVNTPPTLTQTVKAMRETFGPDTIISKALWQDEGVIHDIKDYLTFGGIMYYGNSASRLEDYYENYKTKGLTNEQLLIGVNAGPVAQSGAFTSVETAKQLTNWQPKVGKKRGMMVWTFSQDIQQFTANPQNQEALQWPNANDHEWQRAIIGEMDK